MHEKTIKKYNWEIHELAEDIGNLDYDTLQELFIALQQKFTKDALHDQSLDHPQVAKILDNIAKNLLQLVQEDIEPLAKLCRPYNEKGDLMESFKL
jgi:oligoendopeptidase F